jgi:tetratricopeptide (TPR) repeat protein
MPCVYCGQAVGREVERCPHCKASYSIAVRRASREVEGAWFYLEPRNLSNRGVDFATMLKLIEKGRLKRDSVVRGPTTHQDWMFAAEAPLLSKYLGVCPHCFNPAGPEQEFCANCDRDLDERPGRLRPGSKQAKSPGYFPARDETEENLASALVTHDLAAAAKEAAAAEAAQREAAMRPVEEPVLRDMPEVQALGGQRPRGGEVSGEAKKPRVKLHILALLTVATVVPLGLLMLWLPLEWVMPGSVEREGTMAFNVHHNQVMVRTAILGVFGVKSKAQTEDPQIAELLQEGDTAAENAELEKAEGIFIKVRDDYKGTAGAKEAERKLAAVKETMGRRDQHRQEIMERMQRIKEAVNAGRSDEARRLLGRVNAEDRTIAKKLGVDVALLEEQIGAVEVKKRDAAERERQQGEVRGLLEEARRATEGKRYKEALDIYDKIANKYPTEYLPAGVKLNDFVAEAKARLAETVKSVEAPGVVLPADTATAAQRIWMDLLQLEAKKKYGEALKKCDELMALPEKDRPAGLAQKIKDLKRGELFGEE